MFNSAASRRARQAALASRSAAAPACPLPVPSFDSDDEDDPSPASPCSPTLRAPTSRASGGSAGVKIGENASESVRARETPSKRGAGDDGGHADEKRAGGSAACPSPSARPNSAEGRPHLPKQRIVSPPSKSASPSALSRVAGRAARRAPGGRSSSDGQDRPLAALKLKHPPGAAWGAPRGAAVAPTEGRDDGAGGQFEARPPSRSRSIAREGAGTAAPASTADGQPGRERVAKLLVRPATSWTRLAKT
jgi:hypothetical protein